MVYYCCVSYFNVHRHQCFTSRQFAKHAYFLNCSFETQTNNQFTKLDIKWTESAEWRTMLEFLRPASLSISQIISGADSHWPYCVGKWQREKQPEKAGRKHFCCPCTTADVREISAAQRQRERAGASLFRTVVAENDSVPLGL